MIVAPASFDGNRTVWRLEAEADEAAAPQPSLWIDGFVRPLPANVEATWLALALAPLAPRRIVLPGIVPAGLRLSLEALVRIAVIAEDGQDAAMAPAHLRAALIRDPLDLFLSTLVRVPAGVVIESLSDPPAVGGMPAFGRIVSNAGTLRRHRRQIDGLGELAALLMVAPALGLQSLTSFLCREELGDTDAVELSRVARMANIDLLFPLADVSVLTLADITLQLGIPALASFRSLWARYRMSPDVVAENYRILEAQLPAGSSGDPEIRMARRLAELSPESTRPREARHATPAMDFFVASTTAPD